jgi:hypothetical protein
MEEEGLAQFLADQVYARASGRDETECLLNGPHDQYFIGNLRSAPQKENEDSSSAWGGELLNKLAPVAFGAEFRVQPKAEQLTIAVRLRWSCYYRVFPTFKQQLEHQGKPNNEDRANGHIETIEEIGLVEYQSTEMEEERFGDEEFSEGIEALKSRRRRRTPTDALYLRFKKISCEAVGAIGIHLTGQGDAAKWDVNAANLQHAVDTETKRAQDVALADSENLRTSGGQHTPVRIPETILSDPAGNTYADFCSSQSKSFPSGSGKSR